MKEKRKWLWEFSKKIVVTVTIIFVAVFLFSCILLCIYPDSTAIQSVIDNIRLCLHIVNNFIDRTLVLLGMQSKQVLKMYSRSVRIQGRMNMTIELFIYLFTIGSAISSLLTQATKKAFPNISSNIIALINAVVVGGIGTVFAYIFLNISFGIQNIISIVLMAVCIWIGSMLGYDKVMQTISQIKR